MASVQLNDLTNDLFVFIYHCKLATNIPKLMFDVFAYDDSYSAS